MMYRVTYIDGFKRHTRTMNSLELLLLQQSTSIRVTSYRIISK